MKTFKNIISFLSWSLAGVVVCSVFIGLFSLVVLIASSGDVTEATLSGRGVGVVEVNGEIIGSTQFRKKVNKYLKNDLIKAIVVDIDSPGGAVGASEEMFRIIKRARKTKPVVCAMGTIAASGGLYTALGCDKIVVNRGTLTGSIGVILAMPNVGNAMGKLGVGMTVIKSGKFKDAGSPFRAISADDKELLQSVVNGAYEQFVATIADERKLDVEKVKEFADGRIILGDQAVELGLVDAIGGLDVAGKMALEIAEVEGEPEFVFPQKPEGFMKIFDDVANTISQLGAVASVKTPTLLYRYGY